ncbi:hypothetical protein RHMOL_Rhmol08G0140700 [Rhododendron molle]|uniref:Uncharacterized protein n=1 Tax=Rhododendron molle TaxID=49168 RepID=A0ACC0MPN6_RHOML|nr:hypothetical protein RHMOL_Rhmol08G0140700 [Rhododendron molle]
MRVSFPEADIKENHIEGKIKKWKRDYFYLDAILQIPGFGWNPNENKLVVENDVWNEFVRVSNFEFCLEFHIKYCLIHLLTVCLNLL